MRIMFKGKRSDSAIVTSRPRLNSLRPMTVVPRSFKTTRTKLHPSELQMATAMGREYVRGLRRSAMVFMFLTRFLYFAAVFELSVLRGWSLWVTKAHSSPLALCACIWRAPQPQWRSQRFHAADGSAYPCSFPSRPSQGPQSGVPILRRQLLHNSCKANTGLHRGVVDWLGVATGESLRQATMRSKSCNIRESACPGLLGGSGVILAEDDCPSARHT